MIIGSLGCGFQLAEILAKYARLEGYWLTRVCLVSKVIITTSVTRVLRVIRVIRVIRITRVT
jgi:hypothetical protein